METSITPRTFAEPNKYAALPRIKLLPEAAIIYGYQEFALTKYSVYTPPISNRMLLRKFQLVSRFLQPRNASTERPVNLNKKSFLDIGANGGFFSFWALLSGAHEAIALDMDPKYVNLISTAANHLGYTNLRVVEDKVDNWNEPADIVLALAMVHWLYSCTEVYGSLSAVISKLANLTSYLLIIEWVAPEDSAIKFFNHIEWNQESITGEYNLEEFENALNRYFARVEVIGDITPTRRLYAAWVSEHELDFSGPLPILEEQYTIHSSQFLARLDIIDYWSRIYFTDKKVVIKQATLNLAQREFWFLSQLESDYFPKALYSRTFPTYSILAMEYIEGEKLELAVKFIRSSLSSLRNFMIHCLNLLLILAAKRIQHRDIGLRNILVRNNKPVLIDFGWSSAPDIMDLTPADMGDFRPPDNRYCDVYSMGRVFKFLCSNYTHVFDNIIELMVEEDRTLRIVDIDLLLQLVNQVS